MALPDKEVPLTFQGRKIGYAVLDDNMKVITTFVESSLAQSLFKELFLDGLIKDFSIAPTIKDRGDKNV